MFGNLSLAFEWDLGANAEKNQAAANSSLAEVWHRCADCGVNTVSGLVTIWQKPNGEVWVRNGTSTGPVYYQMPVEAQMGSPFEIIMLHSSQERSQLYFFYTQAAANGMSEVFAANWVPSDPPSAGWTNCTFCACSFLFLVPNAMSSIDNYNYDSCFQPYDCVLDRLNGRCP